MHIRATTIAALVASMVLVWPVIAQSPPPGLSWDRAREERLVRPFLDEWARRNSLRLGPSVVSTVAAQVGAFRELHCDASPNCRELDNPAIVVQALDVYLTEASQSTKGVVITLFARLEDAGGLRGGTGWPREAANTLRGQFLPLTVSPSESFQLTIAQADSRYYCLGAADIRVNKSFVEAVGRGTPAPNLISEAKQLVLDVGIQDMTRSCDPRCRRRLRDMIVQSISAWKGACVRCGPMSAWVVRIDEAVFVHHRLFDGLEFAEQEKLDPLLVIDSIVQNRMDWRLAGTSLQRDPISPSYVLLSLERRKKICSQLASGSQVWSDSLRQGLCTAPSKPLLQVTLQNDELNCGRQGSVLACATAGGQVQLAAGDFAFLDAQDNVVFGAGQDRVDLGQVLLHEVGHWWGVPHATGDADPDRRTNIMDARYNTAGQCMRPGNLRSMEFAVDRDWPERLAGCDALTYPRSQSRSQ